MFPSIPQHGIYCKKTESTDLEWAYLEKLLCAWRMHDLASWCLFPFCLTKHVSQYFIAATFLRRLRSPLSFSGSTVLIGFHFPAPRFGHHIKDASFLRCVLHKSLPLPLFPSFSSLISYEINCILLCVCVQCVPTGCCGIWGSKVEDNFLSDTPVRQRMTSYPSRLWSLLTSTFADVCTNWTIVPHCSCST